VKNDIAQFGGNCDVHGELFRKAQRQHITALLLAKGLFRTVLGKQKLTQLGCNEEMAGGAASYLIARSTREKL